MSTTTRRPVDGSGARPKECLGGGKDKVCDLGTCEDSFSFAFAFFSPSSSLSSSLPRTEELHKGFKKTTFLVGLELDIEGSCLPALPDLGGGREENKEVVVVFVVGGGREEKREEMVLVVVERREGGGRGNLAAASSSSEEA